MPTYPVEYYTTPSRTLFLHTAILKLLHTALLKLLDDMPVKSMQPALLRRHPLQPKISGEKFQYEGLILLPHKNP
jgi:hypothetical protein